jgi:hypothetical protein
MESFETFMAKLAKERSTEPIENEPILETVVIDEKPEINTPPIKEPQKIQESIAPIVEEPVTGYKVFRDKTETFICDMEISGANPANSKARVIIESTDMTYMFEGTIDDRGHCEIPLRKMNFLTENEIGKIKLEVIADDMVFNPWEDTFVATSSKKVTVKVTESVETAPKVGVRISNIR